ncbi:unnamed protein product [Caenorhabditis nigoni]
MDSNELLQFEEDGPMPGQISKENQMSRKKVKQCSEKENKYEEMVRKMKVPDLALMISVPYKLDEWFLASVLGKGKYSKIYRGRNHPNGLWHAVKVENSQRKASYASHEVSILRTIMYPKEVPHIPKPLAYVKTPSISYFAMTLLGRNISDLKLESPEQRFPSGTTSRIGLQVLHALKSIHEKGIIHRNIKPSKLMMGHEEDGKRWRIVHVIGFGFARQWAYNQDKSNPAKMHPRPLRKKVRFRGSLKFSSPNAHLGCDLSRRDDLWSLLFTLIDLNGSLPWAGERDHSILAKKKLNPEIVLADMPQSFDKVMKHLIELKPLERPDYYMFFNVLRTLMFESGQIPECKYIFESEDLTYEELRIRKKEEWEEITGTFFEKDFIEINGPEKCLRKKKEWKTPNLDEFVSARDLVIDEEMKEYRKLPAEREDYEKKKKRDVKYMAKIEREKDRTKLLYEFKPTNGEEKYEHRRAANQLRADHDLKREKEKIFGGKKKKGEYMACESLRERGEKHKNEQEENIPIGEHLDIKKRSLAYREMLNTGEEMKFEASPQIDDASLDQDGP